MPVVVTGAAGFIGWHLVRLLAARGHALVAIDRRPAPDLPPEVRYLQRDLADAGPDVADVLAAAEAVHHLAATPGVRTIHPGIEQRRARDNVLATAHVLAATPLDAPVVVASSSSVYGGHAGDPGRPSREADPLRPRGGYARSKVAVERLCHLRARQGGLVAVARPFTVAGECQRPDMAIAAWLAAARAGRPLKLLGAPDRCRDITDVRDVVEGLTRLASLGRPATVNLGTGRPWSLHEIVDTIGDVLGQRPRVVVEAAPADEPDATWADTTRCEELLGLRPAADLRGLIERQAVASHPVAVAVAV